jgi:hypothetical protein
VWAVNACTIECGFGKLWTQASVAARDHEREAGTLSFLDVGDEFKALDEETEFEQLAEAETGVGPLPHTSQS